MRFIGSLLLFTFCVHQGAVFAEEASTGTGDALPASATGSALPDVSSGAVVASPDETGTGSTVIVPSSTGGILPEASSSGTVIDDQSHIPLSPLSIRITEVMWAGSDQSTADEWLELAAIPAMTGAVRTVDMSLAGWSVLRVNGGVETVVARFASGHVIGSGGYAVVANFAAGSSRLRFEPMVQSSAVSIPNTQLLLRLRNASGTPVDEVDDGIGAPFAGANPSGGGTKASMERIDMRTAGTIKANWMTATTARGWDKGANVLGTPGYPNGSIEPIDITPPAAPTDVRAYAVSGATVIVWTRSSSPDVETYALRGAGTGAIVTMPAGATGAVIRGSGAVTGVVAIDVSGNESPSALISVQPLLKPIISESLPDPTGTDDHEWIELHNPLEVPLHLAGWRLKSGSTVFKLPAGSGSVLPPDGRLLLDKSVTGLGLANAGGTVELFLFGMVVDRLSYPGVPEQVSIVAADAGPTPDCMPTPGAGPSDVLPGVDIEGIVSQGSDPLTLNLVAVASGGTLAGATCRWDFGDGYAYDGCNPPAHRMRLAGDLIVRLEARDYCGNTMAHTESVRVLQSKKKEKEEKNSVACTPATFTGITISEFLPAPTDAEKEWIELRNTRPDPVRTCGWSIDDREGGSPAYLIGEHLLESGAHLLLSREETDIALNNDQDIVRLIAPLPQGGTGVLLTIPYADAPHDQTFALREDGARLWTAYPTPGEANRFKQVNLSPGASPLVISAALPDPEGADAAGGEWVELRNVSMRPQWLTKWTLESGSGKSMSLAGIVLARKETLRIDLDPSVFTLKNSDERLMMRDEEGDIRSVLGWQESEEGKPIEYIDGEIIEVSDIRLVEGTVFRMREKRSEGEDRAPLFAASIAGISFMKNIFELEYENLISTLMKDKKIELQNYSNGGSSTILSSGEDIALALLESGFAYVSGSVSFAKRFEYEAHEREARNHLRGIWASGEMAAAIDRQKDGEAMDAVATTEGVRLQIEPLSGLLESGALLRVNTNVPAEVYIAMGTGAFKILSGSVIVTDGQYRLQAEYVLQTSSGITVRSDVAIREYTLKQDHYPTCLMISEVHPSPLSGEAEWVELYNKCDQKVNLLGWSVDDDPEGGSKRTTVRLGISIDPLGFGILSGSILAVSLNNGGDAFALFDPTGRSQDAVHFPGIKKGFSWAHSIDEFCLTSTPTPGIANECTVPPANKRAARTTAKAVSIGLRTIYDALIGDESTMEIFDFSLYTGLNPNNSTKNVFKLVYGLIAGIASILGLALWVMERRRMTKMTPGGTVGSASVEID